MKQLLILSGKGGTGKTTVAAAFIALAKAEAFADCDVDAPNLHLVTRVSGPPEVSEFPGLGKARIDRERCTDCGLCEARCAFGAIREGRVDPLLCEGCGVCARLCPAGAVSMVGEVSGDLALYKDARAVFSTAALRMGSGASGRLVSEVKKQLTGAAHGAKFAIVDGSPGIGCPVVASVSGADYVLIVAEATLSGLHDMARVVETARILGVPCGVCINRCDVSPAAAEAVARHCEKWSVPVLGTIPYDETVVLAVNRCQSMAEYPDSPAGRAIARLWRAVSTAFDSENAPQSNKRS